MVTANLPRARCSIVPQVTGESGNRRDDDDDPEFSIFFSCSYACIHNGLADRVQYGLLLFSGSSNFEIISVCSPRDGICDLLKN